MLGVRAADSRYRIREELANYRLIEDLPLQRSRFGLLPRPPVFQGPVVPISTERAAQNAILRIVSVAEAFVFGLLVDATEPQLPTQPLVDALWESQVDSALSWDGRMKSWVKLHKVNIEAANEYREFRSFIDARNAIAHGLGFLTWHQIRSKRDISAGLKSVGIGVQDRRLEFTSGSVEECAVRAVVFIRFLDEAAPTGSAP